MSYAPHQAKDFHPFSHNNKYNLAWENIIGHLCHNSIVRQGCTYQQVKEQPLYTIYPHTDLCTKVFQYIYKEWRGLSKYLLWFSKDALRNDNWGHGHATGKAMALVEVHSIPGQGSGPSTCAGGMKNWSYGLQLCHKSQEWYILLWTFFVSDDAFTTPAPDGKTWVFKFDSGIYLDLDEDPDAHWQCLLKEKIHEEWAEPATQKPVDRPIPPHLQVYIHIQIHTHTCDKVWKFLVPQGW
jgi:hypothetical protein